MKRQSHAQVAHRPHSVRSKFDAAFRVLMAILLVVTLTPYDPSALAYGQQAEAPASAPADGGATDAAATSTEQLSNEAGTSGQNAVGGGV